MAIRIGDEVVLPQGQSAILRWTGRIQGKPIEYAGVELIGRDAELHGKHSGEYEGHKYFSTEVPGTGLFVSYTQLVGANVQSSLGRAPSDASPAESAMTSANSIVDRRHPNSFAELDHLERMLAERNVECERLRAQLQAVPANSNGSSSSTEAELRKLVEEKEHRIQQMRDIHERKREEFRSTISQLEQDRNAIADNYEERLKTMAEEYEHKLQQSAHNHSGDELESQRTALAAMQNQMLIESEKLKEQREQLEAAQHEFDNRRGSSKSMADEELDAVLHQLETQEKMLNEMRESIAELDALREIESRQRKEIEELKKSTTAGHAPPSRSTTEDGDAPSPTELRKELDETRQRLDLATIELQATQRQLAATTQTLREAETELESSKAEVMPVKAQLVSARVELENTKHELETSSEVSDEHDDKVQIASLRSELAAVRTELGQSRSQSKMLLTELGKAAKSDPERTRLEEALEAMVVRESELEAEIERLGGQVGGLDVAEPVSPKSVPKPDGSSVPTPLSEPQSTSVESSKPAQKLNSASDAAAGRDLWCGLCEREGHTAEECPYDE